jgi:hypothetical protein
VLRYSCCNPKMVRLPYSGGPVLLRRKPTRLADLTSLLQKNTPSGKRQVAMPSTIDALYRPLVSNRKWGSDSGLLSANMCSIICMTTDGHRNMPG